MTLVKVAAAIAAYHLCVGASYAWFYAQVNEPDNVNPQTFVEMTVLWPVYAAGTVEMDKRWHDVMADVRATLSELNSGRWERKPAGSQ